MHGDTTVKQGQIAHVDHNPSNNRTGNLAFLCFDHHNEYDSKASQAKGLRPGEVVFARELLYSALDVPAPRAEPLSSAGQDQVDAGGVALPELYPDFHNEYEFSYARFIGRAEEILYIGTTGFTFLLRHEAALLNSAARGARLRVVLAEPSESNLRTIASWSAFKPNETYERLASREVPEVMKRLRTLKSVAGPRLEVRLLQFHAPVHMAQFDAEASLGSIVLKLYPVGTLPDRQLFRLATVITRSRNASLFEQLRVSGENSWSRAKVQRLR